MKLSLKLLFSALLFLTFSSHALEEPPGSESIADGDRYFEQLAKDRAAGKIHMDKGIENSFDKAMVFIPESNFAKRIKNIKFDQKYPVVIYLHGCAGIQSYHDQQWGQYIANLGFVVILPDSFARPKRISNCDSRTNSVTNNFPMAIPYREQEIAYAMLELKKLSWVDVDNIFFMGHSEGAEALARTQIEGIRGIVLSSGFCFTGIGFEQGVRSLVISYSIDPWFGQAKSRCSNGRMDGSLTTLELSGTGHDNTYDATDARNAVAMFLKQNLKK
jgi:dienelactone hydrolase